MFFTSKRGNALVVAAERQAQSTDQVRVCVSGYVCLRGPAGAFVFEAVDSEVTEYIHIIRSCLFLEVRGIGNGPSASVLSGSAAMRWL